MRPPLLTKRQLEILELIAVGATRNEIARELKISPETVKLHTKALLDKFDAASVRDALSEIVAFTRAYGLNGKGYKTYIDEIDQKVTILENYLDVDFERKTTGYVVIGKFDTHKLRILHTGEISKVAIDGTPPKTQQIDSETTLIFAETKNPLDQGDQFSRHLTYHQKNSPARPFEKLTITIGTPTDKLKLSLDFPDGLPADLSAYLMRGLDVVNLKSHTGADVSIGNNYLRLTAKNLEEDDVYAISWKL